MKRFIVALIIFVGVFVAACCLGGTIRAYAADPCVTCKPRSFGMVGITQGETVRINVVFPFPLLILPTPQPCNVNLSFLDSSGNVVLSVEDALFQSTISLFPN